MYHIKTLFVTQSLTGIILIHVKCGVNVLCVHLVLMILLSCFFSRSVSRLQYTIVSLLLNGRSGPVAINYIFCEQIPVEKEETKILIQIGYLFIIDNTGECQLSLSVTLVPRRSRTALFVLLKSSISI